MNNLPWGHVIEAAEFVYREVISLSDGVERVPGTDFVVLWFGQGKWHPRDSRRRFNVRAVFGRGGW